LFRESREGRKCFPFFPGGLKGVREGEGDCVNQLNINKTYRARVEVEREGGREGERER